MNEGTKIKNFPYFLLFFVKKSEPNKENVLTVELTELLFAESKFHS